MAAAKYPSTDTSPWDILLPTSKTLYFLRVCRTISVGTFFLIRAEPLFSWRPGELPRGNYAGLINSEVAGFILVKPVASIVGFHFPLFRLLSTTSAISKTEVNGAGTLRSHLFTSRRRVSLVKEMTV